MFGHPVYGAALLPGFGSAHYEMLLDYRRIAGFGVMLIDTVNQNNRVEWSRLERKANIHYAIGEDDAGRLRFAAERAVEIMFAAGAREVVIPAEGPLGSLPSAHLSSAEQARHCRDLSFEPHRTVLTSAHPQATMKMSARPTEGMLNARGETHAVQNLIVCDASSFPASCGANPMISIITMARYQGTRIAHEWSRYDP
jgi:choline dehydrogenase-like flavoprotein